MKVEPLTLEDRAVLLHIAMRGLESITTYRSMILDNEADAYVMENIEHGKLLDAQYHNYCISYEEFHPDMMG